MPRFGDEEDADCKGIIDIFDCSSEEFWLKEEPLSKADSDYKCSVQIPESEEDIEEYLGVVFS